MLDGIVQQISKHRGKHPIGSNLDVGKRIVDIERRLRERLFAKRQFRLED